MRGNPTHQAHQTSPFAVVWFRTVMLGIQSALFRPKVVWSYGESSVLGRLLNQLDQAIQCILAVCGLSAETPGFNYYYASLDTRPWADEIRRSLTVSGMEGNRP